MKILFSNLGYAKGISGSLRQHLLGMGRHFYASSRVQQSALAQFRAIIDAERPDVCGLVEIDSGSFSSGYRNQLDALIDVEYCFHDMADKYGEKSRLGRMPLHMGKSNALLSRADYPFKRLYFRHGTKRLIYQVTLPDSLILFFAHFSLQKKVRARQFDEVRELVKAHAGRVIIMADFNILHGFDELAPLLDGTGLVLLNDRTIPTFTFHRRRLTLDLCLCSGELAADAKLTIISQPFSDHAALVVEIT